MKHIKLFEYYNHNSVAHDILELLVDYIPDNVKIQYDNYDILRKQHNEVSRFVLNGNALTGTFTLDKLKDKIQQVEDYYSDEYDIKYTYTYVTPEKRLLQKSVIMSDSFYREGIIYVHLIIHFLSKE